MWKDRFRNFFSDSESKPNGLSSEPTLSQYSGSRFSPKLPNPSAAITRQSNGTEQFFNALRVEEPLSILDMAGASQANVSFLTDMGHRLSSEDVMAAMDQCFGDGDFLENQTMASRAQRFMDMALNFAPEQFDAVLAWDTFQFLVPPLLDQVVERVLSLVRPGGTILAFFSSTDKITRMPLYQYRIQDAKTLLLAPRNSQRQIQYLNNRMIERLFHQAQSVKFFLSRDHLREIIVRR